MDIMDLVKAMEEKFGVSAEPKAARRLTDRLSALPELRQLSSVSGEFDYIAVLRAPSTARLDALLASVENGAIAPLRGRWVVELEARGGKLQRRLRHRRQRRGQAQHHGRLQRPVQRPGQVVGGQRPAAVPAGHARDHRHQRRAGVDHELHRAAVDRAGGGEMPAQPGLQHDLLCAAQWAQRHLPVLPRKGVIHSGMPGSFYMHGVHHSMAF